MYILYLCTVSVYSISVQYQYPCRLCLLLCLPGRNDQSSGRSLHISCALAGTLLPHPADDRAKLSPRAPVRARTRTRVSPPLILSRGSPSTPPNPNHLPTPYLVPKNEPLRRYQHCFEAASSSPIQPTAFFCLCSPPSHFPPHSHIMSC